MVLSAFDDPRVLPASIVPGHQPMVGTRNPPSAGVAFGRNTRKAQFACGNHSRTGPLDSIGKDRQDPQYSTGLCSAVLAMLGKAKINIEYQILNPTRYSLLLRAKVLPKFLRLVSSELRVRDNMIDLGDD